MQVTIFEGRATHNFSPLTLTRPCFTLLLGAQTLLTSLLDSLATSRYSLLVRDHLVDTTKAHLSVDVNSFEKDEEALLVNGLAKPWMKDFHKMLRKKERFAAMDDGNLVLAKVVGRELDGNLSPTNIDGKFRRMHNKYELSSGLWKYPWELIEDNSEAISRQFALKSDRMQVEASNVLGSTKQVSIDGEATIEPNVVFDTRFGPITVEQEAEIQSFSRVVGPAYIGKQTIIRSALVGKGTSIADQCRIGGEVEQSLFSRYSNKAHSGFFGHSYVGEWVNVGALTANSDLKNTYGTVRMNFQGEKVDSGLLKVGCFLGDYCKTSIGTQIYTGIRAGVCSHLHGFVSEDVPSFTIYAKTLGSKLTELELDSAIETQRRMMRRRHIKPEHHDIELLRRVFELTQSERYMAGVLKTQFSLG